MRLRPEQLPAHLQRRGLPAICLIGGEEPLQRGECADAVRRAARAAGAEERLSYDAAGKIDWQVLAQSCASLSLFASRRLIEIDLHECRVGQEGGAFIGALAEQPAGDDFYLLLAEKPERAVQESKWFRAIEQRGVVVLAQQIPPPQLPGWIAQRLAARDRCITAAAAELIADRVEGNLLAAAQEVEKLLLLSAAPEIDEAEVAAAVLDSARYDMYATVDQALAGDPVRTIRMVRGLRGEGLDPLLLSWLINRELRTLAAMRVALDAGLSLADTLAKHKVWSTRKAASTAALKRHDAATCIHLLRASYRLDRIVKGVEVGDAWDLMEWMLLEVAVPAAKIPQPA
ncbi:MAG: DNA polymerase III subunit delta [Gammaproteobacteria bacterium]|nr:DNA polymerase III subunit delta [Gammaproteobacteria bacterium]